MVYSFHQLYPLVSKALRPPALVDPSLDGVLIRGWRM